MDEKEYLKRKPQEGYFTSDVLGKIWQEAENAAEHDEYHKGRKAYLDLAMAAEYILLERKEKLTRYVGNPDWGGG